MSVSRSRDVTKEYKDNLYNISVDVSGWDTVTWQVLAPVAGTLYVYGSIDDNMPQGSLLASNENYDPDNIRNWQSVQCVALATGTAATSITSAGLYSVPVNAPYMKIGGGGANVYGLWQNNLKIS